MSLWTGSLEKIVKVGDERFVVRNLSYLEIYTIYCITLQTKNMYVHVCNSLHVVPTTFLQIIYIHDVLIYKKNS